MTHKIDAGFISIEVLVQGYLDNNVYLVDDGAAVMVVDPCEKADQIMEAVGDRKVEAIVLTHFHSDHTGAAAELRQMTGAKVYAHEADADYVESPKKVGTSPIPIHPACPVDVRVSDSDIIRVGNTKWGVLHTPGHSLGSMCWYSEPGCYEGQPNDCVDLDRVPVLLSGDTLFCGTTGRTDFEGGSDFDMARSMQRLHLLPEETLVCPGHNSLTTIGREAMGAFRRWGVC